MEYKVLVRVKFTKAYAIEAASEDEAMAIALHQHNHDTTTNNLNNLGASERFILDVTEVTP